MLIGIDIGGTFTDFAFLEDGGTPRLWTYKVESTPSNLAETVFAGLDEVEGDSAPRQVVHGSTVATNALLEPKDARAALRYYRQLRTRTGDRPAGAASTV